MENGKAKKILIIILVIVAIGGSFFAGMYYQDKKNNKLETKEEKKESTTNNSENDKNKESESTPSTKTEEKKTISAYDYTLTYDSTSFELKGKEGNCEVNYDKEYTGSKPITEGKIVNAKIMQGFRCGGSEAAVLILDTGEIYLASFDCDGNLVYEKEQWLKDYKVKDVEEAWLCPGCAINMACKLTAKVILQDGTEKDVVIELQN